MIKLLALDVDRQWSSEYKMVGTSTFEKDGQEFRIKLSDWDCQEISNFIELKLIAVAQEQVAEQIKALKND